MATLVPVKKPGVFTAPTYSPVNFYNPITKPVVNPTKPVLQNNFSGMNPVIKPGGGVVSNPIISQPITPTIPNTSNIQNSVNGYTPVVKNNILPYVPPPPTVGDGSGGAVTNNTFGPNGIPGTGGNGYIDFPQLVGLQQTYPTAAKILGNAPQLGAVSNLPGLGDEYWNSLYQDTQKKLQDQYFGKGGMSQQLAETLAARGNLGSSLEYNALGDLNKNFSEKLLESLSGINQNRAQQDYQNAQQTRQLQQERDVKNLDSKNFLSELGLRAASSEASDANKFGIGRFEQQVNLSEQAANSRDKARQQLVDLLTSPDVSLSEGQQANILDAIFSNPYLPTSLSQNNASAVAAANSPVSQANPFTGVFQGVGGNLGSFTPKGGVGKAKRLLPNDPNNPTQQDDFANLLLSAR